MRHLVLNYLRCGLVAALATSCAAALGQTDALPEQLKAGCKTEEQCRQLVAQARAREARCQENTIGYIRCSDARADEQIAAALFQQRVEERERRDKAEQDRQFEQRQAEERRERATREKRAQDQADALAKQREADQAAQQQARDERLAAEKAREEKAAAEEEERLRLLGPAGRATELRECFHQTADDCGALLPGLMQVASNDSEKASLVKLEQQLRIERTKRDSASDSSTGGGNVLCVDGSMSPSCVCGGSLRGCCSHHGGVAGCR